MLLKIQKNTKREVYMHHENPKEFKIACDRNQLLVPLLTVHTKRVLPEVPGYVKCSGTMLHASPNLCTSMDDNICPLWYWYNESSRLGLDDRDRLIYIQIDHFKTECPLSF